MKKLFPVFLIFALLCLSVRATEVIQGSIYINFEAGADGDNVTGTIIGSAAVSDSVSVTYSTGTVDDVSSTGAQSATKIATAANYPVDWMFDVGGTQYSGNTGTRGIRTTGGSNGYFRINFGSTQYPVSAGFHFKITAGSTFAQWDMAGWYQYFQIFSLKPDGNLKVMAHWAYSGQSSPSTALTSGQWYWASTKRETVGNLFTINVYNADTMALVTSRTGTVEVDPSGGATIFAMGSIKYGDSHAGHTIDYDNLVINTDGVFPLLPTSVSPMLPVARRIDWTATGISGGIPVRNTVSQTVSAAFGNDSTDARAEIQAKMNATASGQVCVIPAGTYRVNGVLDVPSNITVRGAGIGSTIIKAVGTGTGLFRFGTSSVSVSNNKTISSGATAGSTSIVVNNATGISTGTLLVISETNNASYPVSNDGAVNAPATWVDGWNTSGNRARGQIVKVTNVSGTTLTITPALYTTYSNTPWANYFTPEVKLSGVESLTAYSTNSGTTANFVFNTSEECWLYDVYSDFAEANHVDVRWAYRWLIQKCRFFDGFDHTTECNVAIRHKSSVGRFIDNIVERQLVGIYLQWGSAGNVIGHNYFTGGYNDNASSGTRYLTNDIETSHGAHPQFNLVEGNILQKFRADSYWGTSSDTTLLRNRIEGVRVSTNPYSARGSPSTSYTLAQANFAVDLYDGQINYSLLGNVIGNNGNWSGRSPVRKRTYPSTSDYETPYAIRVGYTADAPSVAPTLTSPTVTLIDHGNWESITDGITWDAGISDHDIPVSLYLTAQPAWWTGSWPAVDPQNVPSDLSDITNPAKTRFLGVEVPEPPAAPATARIRMNVMGL